jgi:hypothetical protein
MARPEAACNPIARLDTDVCDDLAHKNRCEQDHNISIAGMM